MRGGRAKRKPRPAGQASCRCRGVLGLDAKGRLTSEPAPEVRALRGAHHAVGAIALAHDSVHEIQGAAGAQLEILAEFTPASMARLVWPFGAPRTARRKHGSNTTTRTTGSRSTASSHPSICRPIDQAAAGRCIGRRTRPYACTCSSTLRSSRCLRTDGLRPVAFYPTRPDSLGLHVFSRKARPSATFDIIGQPSLTSLEVWELAPIWDGTESIPVHI